MAPHDFTDVETWIFDLDNTLYPPEMRLFDQIEHKMITHIVEIAGVDRRAADALRRHYWQEYGTTLAGLMAEHRIEPKAFLDDVHDIDFSALQPDPALRDAIDALPGRKIIYTNGTAPYAQLVARGRGLEGAFDAVYGIEHAGYRPKPRHDAFATVFDLDGLEPGRAAMFEDDPRNLAAPHDMGLRTVHVAPAAKPEPFIHHHTHDLSDFLKQVAVSPFAAPDPRPISER